MQNNFFCKETCINLYESPSLKSKISTQILYGEKFKILSKKNNWIKIKTFFDNYIGYINKNNYTKKFKSTHKISVLKARIFTRPENFNKYKSNIFLPFASKIKILAKYKNFIMFEKNKWLKTKNIKKINYKQKNFIKVLKLFLGCKYKWGGKTYKGIDCSALLQLFFYFNNNYCPRDTKDQIHIFKKIQIKNSFKKDHIIFWKGHVAVCINSNLLIHAYGPEKKVLIMSIKKTINIIEKTANLRVKKIVKKNLLT